MLKWLGLWNKKHTEPVKEEITKVKKSPVGIKTVIVTDLHGCATRKYSREELTELFSDFDLCLILGDCYSDDIEYILPYLDLRKTYAVYGNHNDYNEKLYEKYGIENIHGKSFVLQGKTFVGWEGSYKYKPSAIGMSQEESIEFEKTLPDKCDYLLSHDGPFKEDSKNAPHAGLQGISNYQKRTGCFILRGHIHDRYETEREQCFYRIEKTIL